MTRCVSERVTPTFATPGPSTELCTPPLHDSALDAAVYTDALRHYSHMEDVYDAANPVQAQDA